MRLHHVSYQGISNILELIYPRGKDTIFNDFAGSVERTAIPPPAEEIQVILYDEQHPKAGRAQKFRLTLLDGVTGQPIAEELHDSKDSATILAFLAKYLDSTKCTFVVTDLYASYPKILKELFGENLIHQLCIMHLNKRIVGDFPNNTTIEQELMKYRLLNIFYNRDAEIAVLRRMAEEEQVMKQRDKKEYNRWLRKQRVAFRKFLHEQELKRRRAKKRAGLLGRCKKTLLEAFLMFVPFLKSG